MVRSSRSEHLRFRYGICLNDGCSKCKSKEVQQINVRKEFVCVECGKTLRECPPPKSWWDKHGKIVISAGVILVVAAVGGIFVWQGNNAAEEAPETGQDVVTDTTGNVADTTGVVADTATVQPVEKETVPAENVEEARPKSSRPAEKSSAKSGSTKADATYGTVDLGYGTYTGDLKNGKPHGHGTVTYKVARKIVSSKDYEAKPGDRYEGEFRDGRISGGPGYWYHENGEITSFRP